MRLAVPSRWREYPVFFAGLAALLLAAAAGAVDGWHQTRRLRATERESARLRLELLTPQARPEMVAAVGAELERAREQLRLARAQWPGWSEAATVPPERLAAYAEMAAFVERTRAAASAARVALAKDECFGFARYRAEAPEDGEVGTALAQLKATERILQALFAAGAERLVRVWREAPNPEGGAAVVRESSEWCALEVVRSVRVPDLVRSHVVRTAFVGTTEQLRAFLLRLAAGPGLVVREVAVAAADEKEEKVKSPRMLGPRSRRFAVTVETVEVAGGGDGVIGGESERSELWPQAVAPAGQQRGFAVFSSPNLAFDETRRTWESVPAESRGGDAFGVELLAVRREPYRWRLVGHVGEGGGSAALLEEASTRRSVCWHVGEGDARSGATLSALEFVQAKNGVREVRAVLADRGETVPVVLTTSRPVGPERLVAVLRVQGNAAPVEIAEGATAQVQGVSYGVRQISTEPVEAEITRSASPGTAAETRRLRAPTK